MRLSGDAVTGSCAWREGEGRRAGGHAYLVVLTVWHEEALRVFLLADKKDHKRNQHMSSTLLAYF